jgi:hypothetical protein
VGRLVDVSSAPVAGVAVNVVKGGKDIMAVETSSDDKFIFRQPETWNLWRFCSEATDFRMFQSAIVVTEPAQKCRRGLVILLDTCGSESC